MASGAGDRARGLLRANQRTLGAMDKSTVFSKSGKGLLEIKSKSNRLSKDEFRVLNLVDGRVSLQDLTIEVFRLNQVAPVMMLQGKLQKFGDGGHTRILPRLKSVYAVRGPEGFEIP